MAMISMSKKPLIEEMATNQERNLMVVCERLMIDFDESESSLELCVKIRDTLMEDSEYLLKMLQEESLKILFDLWDEKETSISLETNYHYLQQLRYLGFVHIEEEVVSVNLEAKDIFYFALKSRRKDAAIARYTLWEQVIFGMLFFYGIIDVFYCYDIFKGTVEDEVSYEELEEFLLVRIIFWNSGILLYDGKRKRLFMASREVMNRNDVLDHWNQIQDIGFRIYSKDEYVAMAMGNGITDWEGIHELFVYILDEIEDDRYKAMLIIKSIVLMIQNGASYLDTVVHFSKLADFESEDQETEFYNCIKTVFYHTPLYGKKGYSLWEFSELQTKNDRFRIIEGGKDC